MQKRCWQAQHASQVSSLRSDHGLTAFIMRSFLEAATKAGLNVLETDPLKIKDFPQHRPSFKSKVKSFSCGSGKSFGTWISQLPETCLFSSVCSLKAQDLIKPWDWPLKKTHISSWCSGPKACLNSSNVQGIQVDLGWQTRSHPLRSNSESSTTEVACIYCQVGPENICNRTCTASAAQGYILAFSLNALILWCHMRQLAPHVTGTQLMHATDTATVAFARLRTQGLHKRQLARCVAFFKQLWIRCAQLPGCTRATSCRYMLQWSWVIGPLKVLIHVGLEMHEAQKTGVITDLISCASLQHQVAFESLHVAHCRNKHMVFRNIQLLEASANGVHREAANLCFSSRVKIILQDSASIWFLAKILGANGLTSLAMLFF